MLKVDGYRYTRGIIVYIIVTIVFVGCTERNDCDCGRYVVAIKVLVVTVVTVLHHEHGLFRVH